MNNFISELINSSSGISITKLWISCASILPLIVLLFTTSYGLYLVHCMFAGTGDAPLKLFFWEQENGYRNKAGFHTKKYYSEKYF